MFDGIRYLLQVLLGPGPELRGVWQRVGDNFAGSRIAVEETGAGLQGRLIYVPDNMQAVGWKTGEVKWTQITGLGRSGCSLQDKYKLYDTRRQRMTTSGYTDSRLRFLTEDEIIVSAHAPDRGSFSRWRRIGII